MKKLVIVALAFVTVANIEAMDFIKRNAGNLFGVTATVAMPWAGAKSAQVLSSRVSLIGNWQTAATSAASATVGYALNAETPVTEFVKAKNPVAKVVVNGIAVAALAAVGGAVTKTSIFNSGAWSLNMDVVRHALYAAAGIYGAVKLVQAGRNALQAARTRRIAQLETGMSAGTTQP